MTLPSYEEDNDEDGDLSDNDFEPVFLSSSGELSFKHHACFAHTLQLVIKDGMKKNRSNADCDKMMFEARFLSAKSTIAIVFSVIIQPGGIRN